MGSRGARWLGLVNRYGVVVALVGPRSVRARVAVVVLGVLGLWGGSEVRRENHRETGVAGSVSFVGEPPSLVFTPSHLAPPPRDRMQVVYTCTSRRTSVFGYEAEAAATLEFEIRRFARGNLEVMQHIAAVQSQAGKVFDQALASMKSPEEWHWHFSRTALPGAMSPVASNDPVFARSALTLAASKGSGGSIGLLFFVAKELQGFGGVAVIVSVVWWSARRLVYGYLDSVFAKHAAGKCPTCSYDLRTGGLTLCPECGVDSVATVTEAQAIADAIGYRGG